MKKFSFTLLMLVFAVACMYAQIDPTTTGAYHCFLNKSGMQELPLLPSQVNTIGPHSFDVLKYTLDLNIYHCYTTPYPKDFSANVRIQFKADSSISFIKLNASNTSLDVDSIKLNAVSFTQLGDILTVNLDQTYNPGQVAEILIYYKHNNVTDGAFYASGGFVFTDCEPEGARHWFPCYDSPSDKALMDLTVKVPPNVKLGSNGRLADSTFIAGDTLQYHWVSANNIATYLMVMTSRVNYKLDIKYYHKYTNPNDSVPMRFYYNPGENPFPMENIIDSMTRYYSRNWCEHPFEKNGFATLNSQFAWGGMENQTLTSLCPNCWSTDVVSHEFAHQWYGDMITCDTWADIWLNEGFATWSEAYWLESSLGYPSYLQLIQSYAGSYLQSNPGWAISDSSWATNTPSVNVLFDYYITYCKGGSVLHQLRYVLGDSTFFQVMKTYCADTNYKYKSATIGNYRDVVNAVTGGDYTWFFNEWIFQPNHPRYANTYQFKDQGNGNWKVDFNARQTQTNASFFKMPLPVKIHFTDNTDTTIKVMNDVNNQLFSFWFSKQPQNLAFDPDDEIVLKEGQTIAGIPENEDRSGVILGQNAPNPVSSVTKIPFVIPISSTVQISVVNTLGIEVWKTPYVNYSAGAHTLEADLSSQPAGVYVYIMITEGRKYAGKMVVSR